MNAMKITGKAFALCAAAGIAAVTFIACGNKADESDTTKKTEDKGKDASAQTQTAAPAQDAVQPGAQSVGKESSAEGVKTASEASAEIVKTAAADAAAGPVAEEDDDAFTFKPATEAEILELLYFLPDPLAKIDGEAVPRSTIIDDLVEQEVPLDYLEYIGEKRLREGLKGDIELIVKSKVMLKLAEEAGFKPSVELLEKDIRAEFDELPEEEQAELEASIKEHEGKTLDEFIKEKAQDTKLQEAVALRKYRLATFLEKAKKEISDEAIQKEYDAHIGEFTMPEGVTVAHILIQPDESEEDEGKADAEAKKKIDAIYEELVKDPEQFGKLAEEKSDCPSGKRDQGVLPAFDKDGMMLDGMGAMDQTFTDAAFTIEEDGKFTEPVKTQFGYHIIKRIKKTPAETVPLEKIKDTIVEHLAVEKAQAELDKTLDEAVKKHAEIMEFAPPRDDEAKKDEAKKE